MFDFNKSIKNSENIDYKINLIIHSYKPKPETKYDGKKSIPNFYVYVNNIFKLTKKYQPQKLDKAISKH